MFKKILCISILGLFFNGTVFCMLPDNEKNKGKDPVEALELAIRKLSLEHEAFADPAALPDEVFYQVLSYVYQACRGNNLAFLRALRKLRFNYEWQQKIEGYARHVLSKPEAFDLPLYCRQAITKQEGECLGPVHALTSMLINGVQYIVSGSAYPDSNIMVWQVTPQGRLKCIQKIQEQNDSLSSGVCSLKSIMINGVQHLVSGFGFPDCCIKVWRVNQQGQLTCIQKLTQQDGGHTKPVLALTSVVINGDLHLVSGSTDESIKVWQTSEQGKLILSQTITKDHGEHPGAVCSLTSMLINNEQHLISGSSYPNYWTKVWKFTPQGQLQCIQTIDHKLSAFTDTVHALTVIRINGEQCLVSGDSCPNENIKVWSVTQQEQLVLKHAIPWREGGHAKPICALTGMQINGEQCIVSGSFDHNIKIWRVNQQGQLICIQTITPNYGGHTEAVFALTSVVIKGDLHLISGSSDGSIKLWQPFDVPQNVSYGQMLVLAQAENFKQRDKHDVAINDKLLIKDFYRLSYEIQQVLRLYFVVPALDGYEAGCVEEMNQ